MKDNEIKRIAIERARSAIVSKYGVVIPYNSKSKELYDQVYESVMKDLAQFNE